MNPHPASMASPDEDSLAKAAATFSSTTNRAWDGLGHAWDSVMERYASFSHGAPETATPNSEVQAAKVLRLNDHALCGPGGRPVAEPWKDLAANYAPPADVPGHALGEVAGGLQQAGTPLRPGDIVQLDGLHVFAPGDYAQGVAHAPASSAVWHQLASPEALAIAGSALVAYATIRAVDNLTRPAPSRTVVEHGR